VTTAPSDEFRRDKSGGVISAAEVQNTAAAADVKPVLRARPSGVGLD
jgi:hypothetical protein